MTDDEIVKALSGAREDQAPPADVEQRTRAALQAAGLLTHRRRWLRPAIATAAIAASLLAGVWMGVTYRSPAPGQSQFLLLLYEDAAWDSRHRDDLPRLQAEYTNWIRSLARAGHATAGEKLEWGGAELVADRPAVMLPDQPAEDRPHGFFIILADNEQAAITVAETCPHLRYGGRIVVRPIDRR